MMVMKFGGTSVGSASRMKEVAQIIDRGERVMVVLSAVSGTTNKLVEIAQSFSSGEKQKGLDTISTLEQSYVPMLQELFSTEKGKEAGKAILDFHFELLRSFARNGFGLRQYKEVLAQGELISTQLFYQYLLEQNKKTVLLNALDFMRIDEDGEPQMEYIATHLNEKLAEQKDAQLIVTQGFICRNPLGEIDNLQRGGSDYSASLIGAAIGVEEIQIWTDIDGMHNNDPRHVEGTFPVRHLSFDEAAELAYFGAKILHPSSVNPARKAGIPVRLKNTMQPDALGTLISSQSDPGNIKAIAAKDNIIAIRVVSNRMFLAYGFLRNVFEVFERYKTPIDMITTSEVAVSLTIDQDLHLDAIVKELETFASLEIDREMSIVSVVGDNLADRSGSINAVVQSMQEIPLRMVSCGGSRNNISMLIETRYKISALKALNVGLFQTVSA
jgi:aspartate kinase